MSRPREVGAALFFAGCAGIIAWNALALQKARHPAPLFNKGVVGASNPAPLARPIGVEPARLPAQDTASATIPDPSLSHPQTSVAAVPMPPKPAQRSPIADLIRNGGEPPVAAAAPPARPGAAPVAAAPSARDPIADIIRMGGAVPVPPASVGKADAEDVVFKGQRALAKLGYGVKIDGAFGPGTRQAIEAFERDKRLPVTGEFTARTVRELSSQAGIQIP
ncbi:peptidoglycan-binding domain-containing protein [Microvirga sp. 2MCAF38]|uniref:peptidoglycan-binding domain-containing protein n=1 Tax=Microvirga sp. 2MCAF38 TaxID=3232989 RepID=UPI003F951450